MRHFLFFIFFLIFTSTVIGQIREDLPTPVETYSKDSKRLIELSGLLGKKNNGKKNFAGRISRLEWHYDFDTVYFDIGKETFNLKFSNISKAARSHLNDLLKKKNRVGILAYAGGSNGIWLVISINQK